MTTLRIAKIHVPVTALGPGRRIGLWVQGCTIGCRGCISTDTWSTDTAPVDTGVVLEEIRGYLNADATLSGVTISGGEPLQQASAIADLLAGVRAIAGPLPLDVLLYTGYPWRRVQRDFRDVLGLVDAVIPEPFVAGRSPGGVWRGSNNQPLILLTDLARERFASRATTRAFQVVVEHGRLYTIGVPKPGDLDAVLSLARAKGLSIAEVSWRS